MKRLLIIGAGFAGMYAAISAARLRHLQGVSPDDLEIALISPEPFLVIRPRLYEPKPETMKAPLTELFQEIGCPLRARVGRDDRQRVRLGELRRARRQA